MLYIPLYRAFPLSTSLNSRGERLLRTQELPEAVAKQSPMLDKIVGGVNALGANPRQVRSRPGLDAGQGESPVRMQSRIRQVPPRSAQSRFQNQLLPPREARQA